MKYKVIFAADLRDPTIDATSTQIMTVNLLRGFRQISSNLILAAMVCEDVDRDAIRRYYADLADEIILVRRITGRGDKYKELAVMMKGCLSVRFEEEKQLAERIDADTYLVSHTPTIDAALLCKRIIKYAKPKRYIQYCSDPLALSMLTPEQYTLKRSPYKWIEKKLYDFADDIVFGGKPLFEAQKRLFGNTAAADRMSYCDVSYIDYSDDPSTLTDRSVFGYIGNYYSKIRNIRPLYNAFRQFEDGKLIICGSGDLNLSSTDNIDVKKRVPQSEVHTIERQIGTEICILNCSGVQVPGKVFYEANTDKLILVITDGPIADDVQLYLSEFNRYIFCENTEKSISEALAQIAGGSIGPDRSQLYRLSPAYVAASILAGGVINEKGEKRTGFEQNR